MNPSALLLIVLAAVPASAGPLEDAAKRFGVELKALKLDDCPGKTACYEASREGKKAVVSAFTPQSLEDALKAAGFAQIKTDKGATAAAEANCPKLQKGGTPRDLAEKVIGREERSAHTGGLSHVDFLMVCANQSAGAANRPGGEVMTRDKAADIIELVKPKPLPKDAKNIAALPPAAGAAAARADGVVATERVAAKDMPKAMLAGGARILPADAFQSAAPLQQGAPNTGTLRVSDVPMPKSKPKPKPKPAAQPANAETDIFSAIGKWWTRVTSSWKKSKNLCKQGTNIGCSSGGMDSPCAPCPD